MLADSDNKGVIGQQRFNVAVRLIAHAHNGKTPSRGLIHTGNDILAHVTNSVPPVKKTQDNKTRSPIKPQSISAVKNRQLWYLTYCTLFRTYSYHDIVAPIPHFEGITPAKTDSPLSGSTPVVSHSTGSDPTISESDKTKYDNMFMAVGPVGGLLDGDKAREVFLKSKLPVDKLSQIWYVHPRCT